MWHGTWNRAEHGIQKGVLRYLWNFMAAIKRQKRHSCAFTFNEWNDLAAVVVETQNRVFTAVTDEDRSRARRIIRRNRDSWRPCDNR